MFEFYRKHSSTVLRDAWDGHWFAFRLVDCYGLSFGRGSNRNRCAFAIRSSLKSSCDGFKRKLESLGMTALGTCKTGTTPREAHTSPILLVALGGWVSAPIVGQRGIVDL